MGVGNKIAAVGILARGWLDRTFRGQRRHCVACNRDVPAFIPFPGGWKSAPALMSALDVIGSDLDHYSCPRCGANDRERHLLLYLEQSGIFREAAGLQILHFAPEPAVERMITQRIPRKYVRADLFVVAPGMERIDLHAIPYPDGSFDVVIANHVLEHVADDARVLSEIRRVLRPGGTAVLQTPYSAVLSRTIEDPAVTSPESRLQLYGQADHVRLYGVDLFERIVAAGFRSRQSSHEGALPDVDAAVFGVNRHEPFMCYSRD
jgi:SAM-dependent methyltransferase